jgi:hypothetical protein
MLAACTQMVTRRYWYRVLESMLIIIFGCGTVQQRAQQPQRLS